MVSYGMICFAIRFEHKHIHVLKSHEHFGVKYKKKNNQSLPLICIVIFAILKQSQ